jgi:hypothetical protein
LHPRTNDEYFEYFFKLAKNIKYNLVVYVDNNIKTLLLSKMTFGPNIIFKNRTDVFTFIDKYLDDDKKIISSENYKNKIPNERKQNPEHIYSEYNLINHSKINFVSNARDCYPEYSFYSWIDFGYAREEKFIPKNLMVYNLPHKIIYHNILTPLQYISPDDMLKTGDIYMTGSSYIVHKSLVYKFEKLYDKKIKDWHSNFITDDDQSLVLQLYFENPDLFHLIQNNNWFSLFTVL